MFFYYDKNMNWRKMKKTVVGNITYFTKNVLPNNLFKISSVCFSSKVEIPHFFSECSKIPVSKYNSCEEMCEKKKHNSNDYILTNNIYYVKELDFFERLIKVYIDVIFNYPKYPVHVQDLHIFCRSILKEKVENVKRSKEHKNRILFGSVEPAPSTLNAYLVELNDESEKNENKTEQNMNEIVEKVKKLYNYKNVLYALFTLEHKKIVFNYTQNILERDLQHCFLNSTVNASKEIYRFIKRNGKDNIYIYVLEYSDNLHILKKRHDFVKNLFFSISEQNKDKHARICRVNT
ncbi:conserved Plasmodium protein, unknown function [Plasmodium malariae]|uniref:Uncharacterized protein n=1 Tax=Plasmodium malariae TaxID=5858 RepID=A0A1C3KM06_PLAMA|nr:conserved Plasmodium protein, unknown function [Plasmodium malariae]